MKWNVRETVIILTPHVYNVCVCNHGLLLFSAKIAMSSGLGLVFYCIKHYADVCLGLRKKNVTKIDTNDKTVIIMLRKQFLYSLKKKSEVYVICT